MAKRKIKISLGGTRTTPKKTKALTTPASPETTDHIALLAKKLKDHSKAVWGAVENMQMKMMVGVVECIAKLWKITEDLRQMVVAQPRLRANTNFVGTSRMNPTQVPQ